MKKKKLLILGGADIQISAILKAKELGCHTITCDYLPENPGHKYADEYYNVSTTNKDEVYSLASRLKIDGISSYASDPGAVTAADVSEKMGIPGNPLHSVQLLSDKYTFRATQRDLNHPHPAFRSITSAKEIVEAISDFDHGVVLKPVDTSGSKGICRIDKETYRTQGLDYVSEAFAKALEYSRVKRIIVEEYVERRGFLMSGDFLIERGRIVFICFGDVHFNTRVNGIVPRSISLPASKDREFIDRAMNILQQLITKLQIQTGVFNADVIENEHGEPVVIDIGARNGGNMFNDIIFYNTGVNLIELSLRQCVGEPVSVEYDGSILGYYAHNVIHSEQDGIFERVDYSEEIQPLIIFESLNAKPGLTVSRFVNSSFRLGLILLKFKDFEQMHNILSNIHKHVNTKLKNK